MLLVLIISLTFNSVTELAESIALERFRVEETLINTRFFSGPRVVIYLNSPSYRFTKDLVYYPSYKYPLEIVHRRVFSDAGITVENIFSKANLNVSLDYLGEFNEFNIYSPERRRSFNLLFNVEKRIFKDPYTIRLKKKEIRREIQLLEAIREREKFVRSVQKAYIKLLYLAEIRDVYDVLFENIHSISRVFDSVLSEESPENILTISSFILEVESRLLEISREFEKTEDMLKEILALDTVLLEDSLIPLKFNGEVSRINWKIDSLKIELSKLEDLEGLECPDLDFSLGATISGIGRSAPEAFSKISLRNLIIGVRFEVPLPFSLKYQDFVKSKYRYKLANKRIEYELKVKDRFLTSQKAEYINRVFEMKEKYRKILRSALTYLSEGRLSIIAFAKFYMSVLKSYEHFLETMYNYDLHIIEVEGN